MRIPFKCSNTSNSWIIIELQGELEINKSISDSLYLGEFSIKSNNNNQVELIIGDQLLQGTSIKLKKPLGIFQKEIKDNIQYNLVSLVKTKYLFQQRPKVINK